MAWGEAVGLRLPGIPSGGSLTSSHLFSLQTWLCWPEGEAELAWALRFLSQPCLFAGNQTPCNVNYLLEKTVYFTKF